jgi:uncharacterized OB-fold protein
MMLEPRDLIVPAPTPTGETERFWQGCRDGELLLQHCSTCERWVFYPRAICPHCWSDALEWRVASGAGVVRSFTIVHKPGHPGWAAAAPYTVAVIDLAEGPRMLTALVGVAPADVRIGARVVVRFETVGEFTLPFFESAAPAAPAAPAQA